MIQIEFAVGDVDQALAAAAPVATAADTFDPPLPPLAAAAPVVAAAGTFNPPLPPLAAAAPVAAALRQ
jgi:hypothetical protein